MKVKVMQVGPIGTNCYILEDEATNKAAVIDTATTTTLPLFPN